MTNGFDSVALAADGSEMSLPVRITMQDRCTTGDMEIIGGILAKRADKSLLVSVEDPGGGVLGAKRLNFSDLKDGLTLNFPIKKPASLRPLAIYLCSDQTAAKGCAGKAFMSMTPLFAKAAKGSKTQRSSDIIFYAGTLLADNAGVSFPAAFLANDAAYKKVDSYLVGRGVKAAEQAKIKAQLQNLTAGTKSVPMVGKNGQVLLPLARLGGAGCSGDPFGDERRSNIRRPR
jgi:hypothetical protein